jgi:hypothetical protein
LVLARQALQQQQLQWWTTNFKQATAPLGLVSGVYQAPLVPSRSAMQQQLRQGPQVTSSNQGSHHQPSSSSSWNSSNSRHRPTDPLLPLLLLVLRPQAGACWMLRLLLRLLQQPRLPARLQQQQVASGATFCRMLGATGATKPYGACQGSWAVRAALGQPAALLLPSARQAARSSLPSAKPASGTRATQQQPAQTHVRPGAARA